LFYVEIPVRNDRPAKLHEFYTKPAKNAIFSGSGHVMTDGGMPANAYICSPKPPEAVDKQSSITV